MKNDQRPEDYEALIKLIHERYDKMSKTYQKISVYLTQNPNEIAVQPVNSIAEQVGIHASSFVRFAQALGYKGFKELQTLFQRRLTTAAPGFEARSKALEETLANREDMSEFGFLRDMVVQDITALQELLEDNKQEDFKLAADLIHNAKTVYILGQLRAEPISLLIRYMLTMLGKPCVLLDSSGGLATHMAKSISKDDVMIAISFRYYANEVVTITENAYANDISIIAISDSTLSPLAKTSRVLFTAPERDHKLTRSISAPICLAQALLVAVASRVQDNPTSPRIPTVTEK